MTHKEEQTLYRLLLNALDVSGIEVNIRPYSGRCMFGKQCVGITGDQGDCMELISVAIGEMFNLVQDNELDPYDATDFTRELLHFSQDSMGLGVVLYWSREEWKEEYHEDETCG